jgi:hypothetical protein
LFAGFFGSICDISNKFAQWWSKWEWRGIAYSNTLTYAFSDSKRFTYSYSKCFSFSFALFQSFSFTDSYFDSQPDANAFAYSSAC